MTYYDVYNGRLIVKSKIKLKIHIRCQRQRTAIHFSFEKLVHVALTVVTNLDSMRLFTYYVRASVSKTLKVNSKKNLLMTNVVHRLLGCPVA